VYVPDPTIKVPLTLFPQGFQYKLFGLIPTDRHLLGVSGAGNTPESSLFILGTDDQGRDQWSRLMYATQVSLLIDLVSVVISLVLCVFLGWLSGYMS
jgi:peptide/nickel transport system permease protein